MDFYSIAAKTVLFPTSKVVILPLIAGLFHFYDRLVVSRATYLLLFTFILNHLLKEVLPNLTFLPRFSSPSDYMQSITVFVLFLAWETENNLYKLLSLLYCIAAGYSLISLDYSNLDNVLSGFGFGAVSVYIMRKIAYINLFTKKEYILPIFLNILSISTIYLLLQNSYSQLWISIGSFVGFAIGLYFREKKQLDSVYLGFDLPRILTLLSLVLGILSIYGTVSLIGLIPFISKSFINFIRFCWIAYWIACGSEVYLYELIDKVREQHRLKQESSF